MPDVSSQNCLEIYLINKKLILLQYTKIGLQISNFHNETVLFNIYSRHLPQGFGLSKDGVREVRASKLLLDWCCRLMSGGPFTPPHPPEQPSSSQSCISLSNQEECLWILVSTAVFLVSRFSISAWTLFGLISIFLFLFFLRGPCTKARAETTLVLWFAIWLKGL